MRMGNDRLTQEIDWYIKQNLRPEGFKLKDFLDVLGVYEFSRALIIIGENYDEI